MDNSNKKAVKAGLGYVIGNYLLKGLTFFTIPIFTRLLSTSDYGIYNTFIAYESIFFVIVGLGIHTSYKNAKYRYEEKYDEYVSSSFLLLLLSALVWFFVIIFFKSFLVKILQMNAFSLFLLLLYSFSSAVITCINSYMALNYRYKSFLLISAINAIGNIALSIFLIQFVFIDEGYMGRIIGSTVPALLISIFFILYFFRNYKPKVSKEYWSWGLDYSLPIIPHGISQVVLNQFDRIMIQNMIGASQAGIYGFAYNIYSIISVTTMSIGNAWEPWVYEHLNKKEYQTIKKRSSEYILGVLMFTICVMLVSPEMVKILGTVDYFDARYSVVPIIAAGFFSFLYTIPSCIEYFNGKTKFIAIGTMGAAILNIVLNFIFIKQFGYIAAAYTTLVTYFVYFLLHYFISRKIEKERIMDVKIIILSIVMILGAILLTYLLMEMMILRFLIVICLFSIVVAYEEKHFGFIKKKVLKRG